MEITSPEFVLLPIGLGLLGFIEPCTIGGHLIYLRSQNNLPHSGRMRSLLAFIATRSIVAGMFGGFVAILGEMLIGLQTTLWLAFGTVYLVLGATFLVGRSRLLKKRINLAPEVWRQAQNPIVLGLVFGLNIPACAAPILFGLLGLAASVGAASTGFLMMFLFGLFLSLPLALFVFLPRLTGSLESLGERMKNMRWLTGIVFVSLGAWSIWFGLFVDSANWAGL